MPQYQPEELFSFFAKDAKYNIGQGMGNAFSKAVDLVIARGARDLSEEEIIKIIFYFRDVFFEDNQKRVEEEYNKFLEINNPEIWYKNQLLLKERVSEAVEAGVPTIQQEDHNKKPLF